MPLPRPRAVVTGLGAVSPLGWGVRALRDGLLAGRCALGPVRRFDASPFRSAGGGEVPEAPPGACAGLDGDDAPPAARYLVFAAREAVESSGVPREGTWLVAGTNFGGMSAAERSLAGGGTGDVSAYEFRGQLDRCARSLGLTGQCVALSLTCASGTAALVVALDLVRSGRAERVLAAGYDELSLFSFAGLASLRAMSPSALRPFDGRRDGTLFSEGAGALAVEEAESARARGATPLAEVSGGALMNDAYHMTAPEKDGRGVRALMRAALADAGLSPDRIDHVNLHGTGTRYNDLIEAAAVKDVFAGRRVPATALKGTLGHAMGAAGALESAAAVLTIREGAIPPTVGLEEQDPECDLDVVTGSPRRADVRAVLKTSYGMGGTDAAVVLSRA